MMSSLKIFKYSEPRYLDNVGGWQQEAVSPVLVVLRQLECVAVVDVLSDVPGVGTQNVTLNQRSTFPFAHQSSVAPPAIPQAPNTSLAVPG